MTSPEEEGGWHASNASNEDDLRHNDFNDHLYHDGLNDDFKIDLHKLVSMMIFDTMISLLIIINDLHHIDFNDDLRCDDFNDIFNDDPRHNHFNDDFNDNQDDIDKYVDKADGFSKQNETIFNQIICMHNKLLHICTYHVSNTT